MRNKTLLLPAFVLLTLGFSACGDALTVTSNHSAHNIANATNSAPINSPPTAAPSPTASNTSSPTPDNSDKDEIEGELQVGKTESVILYVGMESGDYAAYCFTNESAAGRAILAACKNKQQCQVSGSVDHEAGCKVPGLEATLSASGRIITVGSVRSIGPRK